MSVETRNEYERKLEIWLKKHPAHWPESLPSDRSFSYSADDPVMADPSLAHAFTMTGSDDSDTYTEGKPSLIVYPKVVTRINTVLLEGGLADVGQPASHFWVMLDGVYWLTVSFVTWALGGEMDDDVFISIFKKGPGLSEPKLIGSAFKGEQAFRVNTGNDSQIVPEGAISRIGATISVAAELHRGDVIRTYVSGDSLTADPSTGYRRRLNAYDFSGHYLGRSGVINIDGSTVTPAIGTMTFDRVHNKPVWFGSGGKWVDALGNEQS